MSTRHFAYAEIVKATNNFDPKFLIQDHRPEGHEMYVQSEMFKVTLANTTFAGKVFVSNNNNSNM